MAMRSYAQHHFSFTAEAQRKISVLHFFILCVWYVCFILRTNPQMTLMKQMSQMKF